MRSAAAKVTILPPPIGGINSSANYDDFGPNDAVDLLNMLPKSSSVDVRKGSRLHQDPAGTGIVKTIFSHSEPNGTQKLLCAIGGKINDVTSYLGSPTVFSPTFTSDEFSTAQTGGFTVVVNGADTPHRYSVGSGLNTTTFTGTGLTASKLIHVSSHRGRLFFVEKDSGKVWYNPDSPGLSGGALQVEDYSSIYSRGGQTLFTTSYGADTGAGFDNLLVVASSNGEILIYKGASPIDSAYTLVNKFYITPILGRRGYCQIGSDIIFLTVTGVYALSRLILAGEKQDYTEYATSKKIYDLWTSLTAGREESLGWFAFEDTSHPFVYINIPDSSSSQQLVYNTQTGAWSRLNGLNMYHATMHKSRPYFGNYSGQVIENNIGFIDYGATKPATWRLRTAYSYHGNPKVKKRFNQVIPTIYIGKTTSFYVGISIDSKDVRDKYLTTLSIDAGSLWDTFMWDTTEWGDGALITDEYLGLNQNGYSSSLCLEGDFTGSDISFKNFKMLSTLAGIK
jgi:hypothetical protein